MISTPPSKLPQRDWQGLYLGLEFGLTAILGLALGHWIDKRFHCLPLGTLAGLFGGAILGIYNLTRTLK